MITLLHRAVSTSKDSVVQGLAPIMVKFIRQLEETIDMNHLKLTFKYECLWTPDDPTLSKTAKTKYNLQEVTIDAASNNRLVKGAR